MPVYESSEFNSYQTGGGITVSVYSGLTAGTPSSWPVTLEEAKAYCRIQESADDSIVLALIQAATVYAEDYTNRSIAPKTYTLKLPQFPVAEIKLPKPIVQSVTSIQYIDTSGATQTFSSGNYFIVAADLEASIFLNYGQTWPSTRTNRQAVTVTYVAGYSTCPELLKTCIKMLVNHWYENRQPSVTGTISSDIKLTVDSILNMYRIMAI